MADYILLIIVTLGGLALLLSIGTVKKMPYASVWSRRAIRISGSCAIMWSVLKVMQMAHTVLSDSEAGRLLQNAKIFLGGLTVGILVTVFMSGAFNKKPK